MDGRRVHGMWLRYQRGDLLAVIGLCYGISAQAVHMALKRAGYQTNRPRGPRPKLRTPSGHPITLCGPAPAFRRPEPSALVWKPHAHHKQPKAEPRVWCAQCDRNVFTAEADRCSSQWCKAKPICQANTKSPCDELSEKSSSRIRKGKGIYLECC